jgi:hypothetical protein
MEDKVEVEVLATPLSHLSCGGSPEWVYTPSYAPFHGYETVLGGEFNRDKLVNSYFFDVIGNLVGLDGEIEFLSKYNKGQLRTANCIRQRIEQSFNSDIWRERKDLLERGENGFGDKDIGYFLISQTGYPKIEAQHLKPNKQSMTGYTSEFIPVKLDEKVSKYENKLITKELLLLSGKRHESYNIMRLKISY